MASRSHGVVAMPARLCSHRAGVIFLLTAVAIAALMAAPRAQGTNPNPSFKSDTDLDGCVDGQESSGGQYYPGYEEFGGERDYQNFWDFYDVPTGASLARDRAVAGTDVFAILTRAHTTGDETIDPLSAPPPAPAYHPAYDRGPVAPGGDPWDLTAADGAIAGTDIFASLVQFGTDCTSPGGGIALSGPNQVPTGQTFTLSIDAVPEPTFPVGGFNSEVLFPAGVSYFVQLCDTEIQVAITGDEIQLCSRSFGGPPHFVRHVVISNFGIEATPLNRPLGDLVHIRFSCDVPGTHQLTLTAKPDSSFGALYTTIHYGELLVPTIPKGDQDVADTHSVTCTGP